MAFSFWLITAVLLLIYLWTLTEAVSIVVTVQDGQCTAVLEERRSKIPCPDLEGGEVGAYLTATSLVQELSYRPLDFLAPGAAWKRISVTAVDGTGPTRLELTGQEMNQSRVISWPAPDAQSYTIQAQVWRPDGEHAGILFLQPGGKNGWLFRVDSENRQAIWRQWQDGQPADPIVGVPYQKPFLAQLQSLLRQVVATFFGALVITLMIAIGERVSRPAVQLKAASDKRSAGSGSPSQPIQKRQAVYATLLIVLAIFGLSLWIAVNKLDRIPHVQDSITYLFQAQTVARGAFWAPAPAIPEAFAQEFLTVGHGKWFGQYLPGYPAVLAIGVLAGAPWLVNPLLAALAAVLLFKLGAVLYRPSTGLLAGGLALLSPFFIFLSGSLMVHAAELFWTLLTMVSWVFALRSPFRKRWAILAGAALGMLLLTRQFTAVAIGTSFVVLVLLIEWLAQKRSPGLGSQAATTLISFLPFVLLLLGYQAAITGSPWQDPRLLSRPFDLPGFGAHIGERENAFKLQVLEEGTAVTWYTDPEQPPRGHSPARGLYNTEQNLEALADHLFGWSPLITLAFCWIPFLLGKPRKYDWVLLATLLTIVAVYIAYWTTGMMYGPRYYFAALPALLLLTARGLQALKDRFGPTATATVFAVLVLLGLLLSWPEKWASLDSYNFISSEELSLVAGQIEEPALVFVPVDDWWDYGRFFSGNTPWLDGLIIYARDLGDEKNNCLQQSYPERAAFRWQPDTKSLTAVVPGNTSCHPGTG